MIEFPAIGAERQFKDYLAEGRFMLQRSRSSGKYVFFPRLVIPASGETDLEWVEARGGGTIYSITVSRRREGSYNIALIDLDEGVRMISTIVGVESAFIGARVKAHIEDLNGQAAVVFTLAEEGAR